jgi:hypothetical protein
MSSNATLRWASVLGTLALALLFSGIVVTSAKPSSAPLHPVVRPLPSDAVIHSNSYVS